MNLFSKIKGYFTKTNQDAISNVPILAPQFVNLATFGAGSVDWIHVIDKQQNDKLIIDYFNQLSEVSSPIRKYSDPVRIVKPELFNKNSESLDNPELKRIIDKFWSENSELLVIYHLLLGNAYVQALTMPSLEKNQPNKLELILFPSEYTSIELKQDSNIDFRNIEIDKYIVDIDDYKYKKVTANSEDVLHLKNNSPFKDSSNNVYGITRLASAEKNLQAIASGYGCRIALYDNGPRVVLTGKAQEGNFASINKTEDTERIQTRLNDTYGRTDGQFQMMVTKTPLDVTNISLNVEELQLNELNSADFRRICNVYNQDSKIHGDPESTTYDNMNTALTDFYINSFQPFIESIFTGLTGLINKKGYPDVNIKGNYDGIKEIAEFKQKQSDEKFSQVEKGLMTRNEYLESINKPTVNQAEFDLYMTFYNGQWLNTSSNGQESTNQSSES